MTIEKITMPQLGESVTEGTISNWLVSVGDKVNKYDPIAEVETDKVSAEVPSSFTGTIKELLANEGDTLEVGGLMCSIEVDGETIDKSTSEEVPKKQENEAKQLETDGEQAPNKRRYSPAVLRLAQEHGIDLESLNGSGKGGRITRKDVQKVIASGEIPKAEPKIQPEKVNVLPTQEIKNEAAPEKLSTGDIEVPVTGVRKAIATNMQRSKQEIPHAWTMVEVDVTNLVAYRNSIKGEFKNKEGYSLTFFAFFIKAVTQALKEFPRMNSMWAGDKIVEKKDINISIAVATEDALYVPVIKNADEKSIKGIAKEISNLANKVRNKTASANDMQGGTFTVNNTGSFGSIQSMGIINYPQAAILQVESIVKRPVVMDQGMIAVRDMVNLCLSIDHRVLDGLISGRFLARIKEILENISEETTSIY